MPAQLIVKAVVQVDAGIVVSMSFIATDSTLEELAPTLFDPPSCAKGEPLTFRAAAGAVLRCAPRIDLRGDRGLLKRFLPGELIDLSPQLVRLFAVEPSGFACSFGLDLA